MPIRKTLSARSCLTLLLVAFAHCSALASRFTPGLSGTELRVLPNGLRLIVREQRSTPLVAVDVWVRAGSGCEGPGESGAAHFLEHLLFKGTPTRKPGEIDAAIEDLGALLNAGTTRDATHFFTTVAAPYVNTAVEVIGDAVRNGLLDPVEMERERAVILDEMARARNDRARQVSDALFSVLYEGRPAARPVLGETESLRTISRETVARFYRRWYAPNNTTVVIVGAITPDAAESLTRKVFGGWEQRTLPPLPSLEAAPASETRPLPEQGAVSLAIGCPLVGDGGLPDLCAADVISLLLSSRGAGLLVEAMKPQAESASASAPAPLTSRAGLARRPALAAPEFQAETEQLRGGSVMAISAEMDVRQLPEARAAVRSSLHRLGAEALDRGTLEAARRLAAGQFLFETETYAGQARTLGRFDALGDYRMARDYLEGLGKLTPADISKFAQRQFEPARQVEVVVSSRAGKQTAREEAPR